MSFVRGLKTWKVFGKGWSNRIADIEARGVKMALAQFAPATSLTIALKSEADKALSAAKTKTTQAAASGGGVASGAVADATLRAEQWVSLGLLAVMVALTVSTVVLIYRARHDKARAAAYAKVADE